MVQRTAYTVVYKRVILYSLYYYTVTGELSTMLCSYFSAVYVHAIAAVVQDKCFLLQCLLRLRQLTE